MKTQLTAEESAKLIELGVNPEKASESKYNRYCQRYLPIFTLANPANPTSRPMLSLTK